MRKEVEQWWKQAKRDLTTAKNCKNSGDYYACAFFCQQSVEKALKALYIEKSVLHHLQHTPWFIMPRRSMHRLNSLLS